jgi:SAM-dependent methyltransferase
MQWFGSLLPRIHRFVPARHVVEIAPGFGRWTRFLHGLCERLTVVDLSEPCLDACRERFGDIDTITYVLNDGRSLDAVPDGSADLVFSYDSLVHAEMETFAAYIEQLPRKLAPDGIAFLHHSNALEAAAAGCPSAYYLDRGHHRGADVGSDRVRALAAERGLACPTQELLPLGSPDDPSAPFFFLDCITTFARAGGAWDRPTARLENALFPSEAATLRAIAPLYASGAPAPETR